MTSRAAQSELTSRHTYRPTHHRGHYSSYPVVRNYVTKCDFLAYLHLTPSISQRQNERHPYHLNTTMLPKLRHKQMRADVTTPSSATTTATTSVTDEHRMGKEQTTKEVSGKKMRAVPGAVSRSSRSSTNIKFISSSGRRVTTTGDKNKKIRIKQGSSNSSGGGSGNTIASRRPSLSIATRTLPTPPPPPPPPLSHLHRPPLSTTTRTLPAPPPPLSPIHRPPLSKTRRTPFISRATPIPTVNVSPIPRSSEDNNNSTLSTKRKREEAAIAPSAAAYVTTARRLIENSKHRAIVSPRHYKDATITTRATGSGGCGRIIDVYNPHFAALLVSSKKGSSIDFERRIIIDGLSKYVNSTYTAAISEEPTLGLSYKVGCATNLDISCEEVFTNSNHKLMYTIPSNTTTDSTCEKTGNEGPIDTDQAANNASLLRLLPLVELYKIAGYMTKHLYADGSTNFMIAQFKLKPPANSLETSVNVKYLSDNIFMLAKINPNTGAYSILNTICNNFYYSTFVGRSCTDVKSNVETIGPSMNAQNNVVVSLVKSHVIFIQPETSSDNFGGASTNVLPTPDADDGCYRLILCRPLMAQNNTLVVSPEAILKL